MPEISLSDEMVERAERALHDSLCTCGTPTCGVVPEGAARGALIAAFDGVPMTNYGIGLALRFFDLVICVKDGAGGAAAAGVYRSNGPDGFDSLGHTLEVQWGHRPQRYLKRVAVGQLDPPSDDQRES